MTKLCIDLCAGLGGFSQAFKQDPNWEVVTVELNKKQKPTICADVCNLPLKQNIKPEALLMSPPCTKFTLIHHSFPSKGTQKAFEIVGACLEAVWFLQPKYWLMENPRGRLRWFIGIPKQTIRYSDYEAKLNTSKPTDLWGNIPLPMVKAIRRPYIGSNLKGWGHTSLGGRDSAERSKIPLGVSQAVKEGAEQNE